MDGLVKKLLRLESAKHKAIIEIDPSAYDAHVQTQLRLLSISKESPDKSNDLEGLLSLSQLITLNTQLLKNFTSTSRQAPYWRSNAGLKRKAATQCR